VRRDPHASQVRSGLSGLSAPCAPLFNSPAVGRHKPLAGGLFLLDAAMVNLVLFFYYWLGKSLFQTYVPFFRYQSYPRSTMACQ
jgi:hypothetical protein